MLQEQYSNAKNRDNSNLNALQRKKLFIRVFFVLIFFFISLKVSSLFLRCFFSVKERRELQNISLIFIVRVFHNHFVCAFFSLHIFHTHLVLFKCSTSIFTQYTFLLDFFSSKSFSLTFSSLFFPSFSWAF